LALLFGLAVMALFGQRGLALRPLQIVAIGALGLLGTLDDRLGLKARPKAVVSCLAAVLLAGDLALRLKGLPGPILLAGLPVPNHLAVTFPLLLLWFWSIPQALNLSDGIDGFALGLSGLAIAASGLALSMAPGFWGLFLGILLLNYPKAFHFLGDCGSLALGGIVAIKVMEGSLREDAVLSLWICAYLVVDVSAVVIGRLRAGLPLGHGDRGHLHHLMVDFLGSARFATPALLLVAGAPMLRGTGTGLAAPGLCLLLALGLVAIFRYRTGTAQGKGRSRFSAHGIEHP
jgi:UDP-GlcNAc:undecaprenyl-phosphate GlcNAc-1-phosphate transferase